MTKEEFRHEYAGIAQCFKQLKDTSIVSVRVREIINRCCDKMDAIFTKVHSVLPDKKIVNE